ncbi:hypothetical protein SUGI_1166730 [Cryptomeria japonica]|nr:hypothetical protein SUGI_1166730 [Cryptomeria japonica]
MRECLRKLFWNNGGFASNVHGGEATEFKSESQTVVEAEPVKIDLSDEIEENIDLWEELVVVKFISRGLFIVIFAEVEEKEKVLLHGNWFVDNHPSYMQLWFPNFDLVPLAPYDNPIWIHLYNLSIEYWGESSLDRFGRTLGSLLEIDEGLVENDSYLYARIKIIAVIRVPSKICFKSIGRIWTQQIEVEYTKCFCSQCGSRDHVRKECIIFVRPTRRWVPKTMREEMVEKVVTPPRKETIVTSVALVIKELVVAKEGEDGRDISKKDGFSPINMDIERGEASRKSQEAQTGLSDMKVDYDMRTEEDFDNEDELDIIDLRSISQSNNALLRRSKGNPLEANEDSYLECQGPLGY